MIETKEFKRWLKSNTKYSDAVISNIASRVKRANNILEWDDDEIYLFFLERCEEYKKLSTSVRSQIKKAVSLYRNYRLSLPDTGRKDFLQFFKEYKKRR